MRLLKIKKPRSIFICFLIELFLLSYFLMSPIDNALADSNLKLTEGAKREGRVVLYTAMATESNQAVKNGFEKKYPFVKLEIFRSR